MSAPYACFEKIVGVANTDCECFTSEFTSEDAESASGLYLSDLAGLSLDIIKAAASCSTGGNTGALMRKAIAEGVKRTKAEVLRFVQANTTWKRPPVVGPKRPSIGDTKNCRTALPMGSTFHGMSLELAHHVGGKATIKRIGTYFTDSGTIDLDIYEIDNDTPIESLTLNTVAGKLEWNAVDIELSMEVDGSKNPRYWFLYEPGAMVALNSRMHCGCGGNNGKPWTYEEYESGKMDDGQAWGPWVKKVGGTKGEDVADRELWSIGNETQGIVLDIEFTCETARAICDGEPDYDNDPLQMSLAYATMFAAGSWIVSTLINSPKVNRETLTGENTNYYQQQAIYEKEFGRFAIDHVCLTLVQPPGDMPASGVNTYADCFWCKNKSGMKVQTILR